MLFADVHTLGIFVRVYFIWKRVSSLIVLTHGNIITKKVNNQKVVSFKQIPHNSRSYHQLFSLFNRDFHDLELNSSSGNSTE